MFEIGSFVRQYAESRCESCDVFDSGNANAKISISWRMHHYLLLQNVQVAAGLMQTTINSEVILVTSLVLLRMQRCKDSYCSIDPRTDAAEKHTWLF